jgi:erythromycin esterase-like protein
MHLDRGWDDRGVQELVRAIGDARVVMLGEPWHGDGAAIRLRSELVQILHQKLGFDVLAFEADFYSLNRGWDAVRTGGDIRAMAQQNIYHFWSMSRASDALWRYIEAQRSTDRPLEVAGVDSRHVGALAAATLPDELEKRLAGVAGVSADQRAKFRTTLEGFLVNEYRRPPAADQNEFLAVLDLLGGALSARDSVNREPFWEQEVRNIRNGALWVWRGGSLDRAMGENLAWLATRAYPGRKIILWAHNNHVIKDKWMYFASPDTLVTRLKRRPTLESIARFTYLGHEARQFFGPTTYSLAVIPYSGRYSPDVRTEDLRQRANFDTLAVLSAAPEGTVEAALANAGHELAFVNLRLMPNALLSARALDYSQTPPMRMRYSEGFDGFVFVRSTFGLNEEPPATWPGRGSKADPAANR